MQIVLEVTEIKKDMGRLGARQTCVKILAALFVGDEASGKQHDGLRVLRVIMGEEVLLQPGLSVEKS